MMCTSCVSATAVEQAFARAASLCDVLRQEQSYAGQRVEVRGVLYADPDERHLYDPQCKKSAGVRGGSRWGRRGRAADAALGPGWRIGLPVVVSGIVRPETGYQDGRRIIHIGGSALEDAFIVAARRTSITLPEN